MARVGTYKPDTDVTKDDKILGTDVSGVTRNYRLQDIGAFFKDTNQAGIAAQLTYQYKANSSSLASGNMGVTFSTGGTFEKITSIKMNKFAYGETVNSSENMMNIYASSSILIVDMADQDNYGVYDTGALTQDSNATDFYDLPLTAKKFNGSLTNDKIYGIISIGTGSDKNNFLEFTASHFAKDGGGNVLTEVINGSSMKYIEWDHDLGKHPSISVEQEGSPGQLAMMPVKHIDKNTVNIYFTGTTSGTIFAN